MKYTRLERWILPAVVGATLLLCPGLKAASVLLQFEESTDLKNWTPVPEDQLIPAGNGALVRTTDDLKSFYRLRIREGAAVPVLPLSEAPRLAVDIAQSFLRDFLVAGEGDEGTDPEGNWLDVELGPVCYPVYDPSVQGGRVPAYMEFKVIKRQRTPATPNRLSGFDLSPPVDDDDKSQFGYILVSLTEGDSPVVQFGDAGPTPVEKLLRKVTGAAAFKPLRFDDGLLVAEGPSGEVLGSLGNEPFRMDPKILEYAGREFNGLAEKGVERSDEVPEFKAVPYSSYEEFKKDFTGNPFFEKLREARAQSARKEWETLKGIEPSVVQIKLKAEELILRGKTVRDFQLDDPTLAEIRRPSTIGGGLLVTGLKAGTGRLDVTFADGTGEAILLAVLGANGASELNLAATGWTSWSYWYAGTWSDQRRYRQFSNDPQMCSSGASGCGPTAWAMLYGWWDRKGSPRALKNTSLADSPVSNDDSVRDCCRYVFNRIGTFCVSGQAATLPWEMKNGYRWGDARGTGYSISWTWGVPYLSPGSVGKARDSIQAGRPSIVGMGFYWHYPLAYGYKSRSYRLLGVTWDVQRYFKCNMGWGGSSPEWRNGSSIWFSTHGRYF